MAGKLSPEDLAEKVEFGGELRGYHDPESETREYWEGTKRDELLIKKCQDCGKVLHPRRQVCGDCRSFNLQWTKASGQGKVYSFSVVYRPPTPQWLDKIPYIVGIIELEEGVYLFSNILCDPGTIRTDLPVTVVFQKDEGGKRVLPKFKPQAENY